MYNDPNPRKTIRKNIHHLESQISQLKKKMNKFQAEIDRLRSIEKNEDIKAARSAVEHWHPLNWLADV